MPKREDEFWAAERAREKKKSCPKCGNTNISYNTNYQTWRCNKCEHSFNLSDDNRETITETEKTYSEIAENIELKSNSKAWFGNEYFDKKTRKWKKPGSKPRTIVVSIIALFVVIAIVVVILLYTFVFANPS